MEKTDNNELEQLRERIKQLEAESAQTLPAEIEQTDEQLVVEQVDSENFEIVEPDTRIVSEQTPVKGKLATFIDFIQAYLIPFVRRQWKLLLLAALALPISIWLLIEVGLWGTIILVVMVGFVIYAGMKDVQSDEYQEVKKQRSRRRSYSQERRALWHLLNKKHGRGKVTCIYCRKPIHRLDRNTHLDHKIPLQRGGTNEFHNMHLVHASCNERKGTTPHKEWMGIMAKERQKEQRKKRSKPATNRQRA